MILSMSDKPTKKPRKRSSRDPSTFVGKYPPHIKQMCKELYLCSTLKMTEISEKSGVPVPTIQTWRRDGKWADERRKLEADLQERSSYEIAKVLRENVGQVVRRHLEVGQLLENAIGDIVKKVSEDPNTKLKPSDLMDLAKGFNQSARITGTTVGVGKTAKFGNTDGPAAVSVLINTNFTPKPAPGLDPIPAIDVSAEEITDTPQSDIDPECGF